MPWFKGYFYMTNERSIKMKEKESEKLKEIFKKGNM
jgi:hypothetical protein